MKNTQFIEVLRIRYFLEHNSKQITCVESEFTIKSNRKEKPVDNIFLTFERFLPNLNVVDAEGTKYPIMTNKDTLTLLEIMKEKSQDSQHISQIMQDVRNRKIFLIWIKVPPNKKLQPNEVRILYLNFKNKKIDSSSQNHIFLNVSSDLPFPVFWILKRPIDFKIANQKYYIIENNKLSSEKSWTDNANDIFYYNDTADSSSIFVKPYQANILISYSFKPNQDIIVLPITSISLLIIFSMSLIIAQIHTIYSDYHTLKLVEDLLDRKIELSLFVVSVSLVIPRFITNPVIRHKYLWWYFVPIGLTVSFLLSNLLI